MITSPEYNLRATYLKKGRLCYKVRTYPNFTDRHVFAQKKGSFFYRNAYEVYSGDLFLGYRLEKDSWYDDGTVSEDTRETFMYASLDSMLRRTRRWYKSLC
jgi:hypothetical protein